MLISDWSSDVCSSDLDMVEAALLRRRGLGVHMANLPTGSHEEFPPTLTDLAVRDRRWCQGNLQHLRLLRGSGFHWVNRLQLLMEIGRASCRERVCEYV